MAERVLAEVDRHGVLLVHDTTLPSVTTFVTGSPVEGSWWSHPMANAIYNALGAIEDDVAVVKLIGGKNTLVARRLWPELVGVAGRSDAWQLDRLADAAVDLVASIGAARDPVVVERSQRPLAEQLERRLLVHATEVHTASGRHVKAYESWRAWAGQRGVVPVGDSASARLVFERIVAGFAPAGRRARLPW